MDIAKVGAFIAAERKKQGLTQEALGEILGVTGKAVSKWERGLSCPDVPLLQRIAMSLRCTVPELLDGELADPTVSSLGHWTPKPSAECLEDLPYTRDVEICDGNSSPLVVSPYLFGNNLEHSRACIFGGLSAQMLRNRKFVGIPGLSGEATEWRRVGEHTLLGFGASYTRHAEGYAMRRRLERNSQTVTGCYDGEVSGIAQDGLFLSEGTSYEFRIVAKVKAPLKLTVRLTDGASTPLAEQELLLEGTTFTSYSLLLSCKKSAEKGSLEICFCGKGSVTIGALSLMPSENYYGMRPDVIEELRKLAPTFLRWPGGNYAGEYYWKDGLLPVDQRAPAESYLGLQTQPYSMGYDFQEIGTDEFLALCRAIGTEPFITINPTWNTPEENAQWVEYCNGDETTRYGRLRIERGYKEPYNVQLWSLGNEAGFDHMEGDNTPYGYRKNAEKHARRMLEVCEHLTLCSSGNYPDAAWAEQSARPMANLAPMVSLHHYTFLYPSFDDPANYRKEYYALLHSVESEFMEKLRLLREQLGDNRLRISFDEWNVWHAWHRAAGSVSEGIFAASLMHAFIRNSHTYGMPMAAYFEAVNDGAIEVLPSGVRLTPAGRAIALTRQHAGGVLRFAEEDAILTERDGVLTATLINRSYDGEKRFLLPSAEVISCEVYTSRDVLPYSDFVRMEGELIKEREQQILTLPAHSIALVRMKASK